MREVFYVMSYPAHIPYLLVSLYTLRKVWDGVIRVFAWDESWPYVKTIAQDHRLSVVAVHRKPEYRGKNEQSIDKVLIAQELPDDTTQLYIDADTTVHKRPDELFIVAENYGFAATQFCDWTLSNGIPRTRIAWLFGIPGVDQALVSETLALDGISRPSVNSGIFACQSKSPVLPDWRAQSLASKHIFISDECVLHLMVQRYERMGKLRTIWGGRWNCSTMRFQPKNLPDDEVGIWHYHGDSNVRTDKSPKGIGLWSPLWGEVWELNLGNCQDWAEEVFLTNKYIRNWQAGPVLGCPRSSQG